MRHRLARYFLIRLTAEHYNRQACGGFDKLPDKLQSLRVGQREVQQNRIKRLSNNYRLGFTEKSLLVAIVYCPGYWPSNMCCKSKASLGLFFPRAKDEWA